MKPERLSNCLSELQQAWFENYTETVVLSNTLPDGLVTVEIVMVSPVKMIVETFKKFSPDSNNVITRTETFRGGNTLIKAQKLLHSWVEKGYDGGTK